MNRKSGGCPSGSDDEKPKAKCEEGTVGQFPSVDGFALRHLHHTSLAIKAAGMEDGGKGGSCHG